MGRKLWWTFTMKKGVGMFLKGEVIYAAFVSSAYGNFSAFTNFKSVSRNRNLLVRLLNRWIAWARSNSRKIIGSERPAAQLEAILYG